MALALRLRALAACSSALLCLAAQTPEPELAGMPAAPGVGTGVARTLHGAVRQGDAIVAGGPDYKARFERGTLRFTPALGRAVERNQSLDLTLEHAIRGDAVVARPAADPRPELSGDVVRVEHDGVVERYRVAPEGLHLSFELAQRPAGAGDLVLALRVATPLPAAEPTADGGVAFTLPGIGGVRVGAVTAVDARGETAPGTLAADGDRLLLVVPGAFVDAAAYPLVVDPLIGAEVGLATSDYDDFDPDAASSALTAARYLVVWERAFSIGDVDVRGARLDQTGAPVDILLFLESGEAGATNPSAAYVRSAQRWLVVWQQQDSVFTPFRVVGCAVDGADGDVSAPISIASSGFAATDPDVGGERTMDDDEALVVWQQAGLGIAAQQVRVQASGAPTLTGAQISVSEDFGSGNDQDPVISESGGDTGVYLLAWQAGPSDIMYRLINRNGGLISGAFLLVASIGQMHRRPAVAGDGVNFMMLWEHSENFSFDSTDVYGLSLTHNGGTDIQHNSIGPIEADPGDVESEPAIVANGGHFVAAWLDQDGASTNLYVNALSPFTCLLCDVEDWTFTPPSDRTPVLTARYAGGSALGDALLAWGNGVSGTGDIYAQLYGSPPGQLDLDGGCGAGGVAETPCPFAGNGNFALHLRSAQPGTQAFLVLAFQQAQAACGPCTIHPSLANPNVLYAGLTDAEGDASVALALPPAAAGVQFWSQWGVVAGGGCDAFGVALSNGVRTTIQP